MLNWVYILLISLIFLEGCTQTNVLRKDKFTEQEVKPKPVRVLLMPMEIELGELTAGGMVEVRADWTQAAKQHLIDALQEKLSAKEAVLVQYKPPTEDSPKLYHYNQLIKLHRAVMGAIIKHKYVEQFKLPTKKGKLDWTLGEDAKLLQKEFNADYALFLFIQDTYTSTERGLLTLLISILFLFPMHPGSVQQGIASLVDLHDGDIEWFNRLVSYTGDLRNIEETQAVIENLLTDLPL